MDDKIKLKRIKQEKTEKAIRDGGFYGKNGVWNSIITFPGDKRLYRERVETLVIKDGKEVFLKKKVNGEYRLPGGSTERELSHIDQAINECREEAHINICNVEATGIHYKEHHKTPEWAKKECEVEWQGTYTEVYVADFESTYHGHVDIKDEDPFIRSGKWYSTKECFKFFRKEHREALMWYLKNHNSKEEPVTESYFINYFKNKRFLKKIGKNPEVAKEDVDDMIASLKKEYNKLSKTKKIQEERKSSDVGSIFHPVFDFEFPDGCRFAVAICFDDKSFTDGAAIYSSEYGYIVVVYPCFFNATKEDQRFTILHEIGHIRLQHIKPGNNVVDIFGNDITNDYRLSVMSRFKAMYPEVNADLYAVLNGASMYTILNAGYRKDYDKEYDYRFTNAELANRYIGVIKKYGRLRGFAIESSDDMYDLTCDIIYEMVYDNNDINHLTESSKDELYSILYEHAINKKIQETEKIKALTEKYNKEVYVFNEKLKEYEESSPKVKEITESKTEFEKDFNFKVVTPRLINRNCFYYKQRVENTKKDLISEKAKVFNEMYDDNEITFETANQIKSELFGMMKEMVHTLEEKREESPQSDKIGHLIFIIESLIK